jgi:hypothetical protein
MPTWKVIKLRVSSMSSKDQQVDNKRNRIRPRFSVILLVLQIIGGLGTENAPRKSTYIVGTTRIRTETSAQRHFVWHNIEKILAFIIAQQIIVSEQCAEAHWNQAHPTQQKISSNTFGG